MRPVLLTAAVTVIALSTQAMTGPSPARSAPATRAAGKIDSLVLSTMDTASRVRVILLGHTQLLARAGGLDDFAKRHATEDRRTTRARTIRELKRIAAAEQSTILRRLQKDKAERSVWIANAIVLTLTPAEIRRAAELSEVEFVYPFSEPPLVPQAVDRHTLVLPPIAPRAFSAAGKKIGWNVEKIGAPRVWNELGVTGEGTITAILDFGTNYGHADLRDNIWRNTKEVPNNSIDDDRNGLIDDYYGFNFAAWRNEVRDTTPGTQPGQQHGTYTAGIAGGDGSGGTVTGVAPRTTLMVMISGGATGTAKAFEYALENGADIVSMSFSLPNLGNLRGFWRTMCEHAIAAGTVLVGGAGNFQQSAKVPYQHWIPKDIPEVISVGGVDTLMSLVPFSSMGPAEWGTVALYGDYAMPNGIIKPDLVAFPGAGYPLLRGGLDSGYIDPGVARGNSFSGPQGAGTAALMFSANPALQAWEVKRILEQTARDLEAPGKDNRTGAGLIDAYAAVKEAARRARK
jgi:subtilisin family serine protease